VKEMDLRKHRVSDRIHLNNTILNKNLKVLMLQS
jgi:hypothetical protein